MAVFMLHLYLTILLLRATISKAAVDKRFSDFKRCADEECSLLLCRGKAAQDFSGPDCRFLTFKKGETIYVYYKLSGKRTDLWAGSVGSIFGYFPKDLLTINHIYTEKELEVSTEETDFVCFDTGSDTFDDYDIDKLLANSLKTERDEPAQKNFEKEDEKDPESNLENLEESEILPAENDHSTIKDSKSITEDAIEDYVKVHDSVEVTEDGYLNEDSTSMSSENPTETLDLEQQKHNPQDDMATDTEENDLHGDQPTRDSFSSMVSHEEDKTTDGPSEPQGETLSKDNTDIEKLEHFSEANIIPDLKTTFGSTFDAVASDDEDTWKVTPYYDEESEKLGEQLNPSMDDSKEIPLLSISEEHISEPHSEEKDLPGVQTEKQKDYNDPKEDESVWTSLGDKVFAIVSGGERTNQVTSLDEDDDDDEEEDEEDNLNLEMPKKAEEAGEKHITPLASDYLQEQKEKVDFPGELNLDKRTESKVNEVVDMSGTALHEPFLEEKTEWKALVEHEVEEVAERDETPDQPEPTGLATDEKSIDEGKEDSNNKDLIQIIPEQTAAELVDRDGIKQLEQDLITESLKISVEAFPEHHTEQHIDMKENVGIIPEQTAEEPIDRDAMLPPEQNLISETVQIPLEASLEHHTEQNVDLKENVGIISEAAQGDQSTFEDVGPSENEEENASEPKDAFPNADLVEDIERVKKELTDLFEETLEKENNQFRKDEESKHYSNEYEELLEDENALLSLPKAEHVDTNNEDVYNVQEDQELEVKEIQTTSKFEELEKSKLTNDAIETGIPLSDPSDVEEMNRSKSGEFKIDSEDTELTDSDQFNSSWSESAVKYTDENSEELDLKNELEYSDSVKQLELLKTFFKENDIKRFHKYLGSQNLFKVESMFIDLELELKATRLTHVDSSEEIEKSLEGILEASETSILDEIERMLDAQELSFDRQHVDGSMFDEEAAVLDDFQELAFQLRQKYSTARDSTQLALENHPRTESEGEIPEIVQEAFEGNTTASDKETADHLPDRDELDSLDTAHHGSDRGFEEDGGHFNRNKDIKQGSFINSEEISRGPQAILENPLDIGLGFEVENPSPGSLDAPSISEHHEEPLEIETSSVFLDISSLLIVAHGYLRKCAEMFLATLPEEWQPGPTFHGLPWDPVIATVAVGILTFIAFTWRTVLAVKSRTYQLTEKQLASRIQQLLDDKCEALNQISELNNKIAEREEQLRDSEKSMSSSQHENDGLKKSIQELQKRSKSMTEKISALSVLMEEEKRKSQEQAHSIAQTEKTIENFNCVLKSNKDELSKFQILMDEARIREEALKAQVTSFEKENRVLKDKKTSLLQVAKDWEEKHRNLIDTMKVLQKSHKDLEDTLAHKENEIEILSDCIEELQQLETCGCVDLQKGASQPLANGEAIENRSDAMKKRIKQMMDVTRVKNTLSIVEEEKNKYLGKLLAEEKERQELEEQIKKLEHDRASLHSEKCHLENQFKTIQQKLEIMNEMYQQKENALQQKLTQEEYERREKEIQLTQVDGKAMRAEDELKAYKKRIQEIEEELLKTERSYKTQIATHEKKAHENWLNARASERALVEEKRETATLRQKLVEVSDKLAEFQRPFFKPTPGRSDHQGPPPLCRGDSYGPSPVSAGAPSPPLMIEGPGRPPSAPVGRRSEPFGPRLPSEPHGRYSDLGHPLPARPDVYAPRTSSPSMDGSSGPVESEAQASTETTEAIGSKSQIQPSFLGSPIRDSPGPGASPQPKGYSLPHKLGPPTPFPHSAMLRPLNGHPPMMPSGPDPRFRPPHPGMGPGSGPGPYGPPRHYGPVPPHYVRGPPPPLRDYPMGTPQFRPRDYHPEMRNSLPTPRDLPFQPRPLLPGAITPAGPPLQHMPMGPRDFPEGSHPGPFVSKDYPPEQGAAQDRTTPPQSGP